MSNYLVDSLIKLSKGKKQLKVGDVVFRANDPVRSLFLVTEGIVLLTRTLRRGCQLTLQRAGAGAILAEASLFADAYHCDAKVVEESTLCIVPLRRLSAEIREDANLASALMRYLAHEVQRARAKAETLSLKTVTERVDAWMTLNKGLLPPKGRWRQVAGEIGVSPEALYRELALRR